MAIEWTYGVVAFLDVLGFGAFIEEDAQRSDPIHLEKLLVSLDEAKKQTPVENLHLRSFSDSIIVSGELTPSVVIDLFESVLGLQRALIRHGVLVRGGVAFGKHFANDDLVYSEALVRAFRIERERARFPRIVIDDDLFDWFINDQTTDNVARTQVTERMLRDSDDEILLHYLNVELLATHKNLLETYSRRNLSASVLEKVQWLAGYHNYVCHSVAPEHLFSGEILPGFRTL